jgi:hypothetical protein
MKEPLEVPRRLGPLRAIDEVRGASTAMSAKSVSAPAR